MNDKVYIYGLWCPVKECFFYVGKSINPVLRLRQHLAAAAPMAKHRKFPHLYHAGNDGRTDPKVDWLIWLTQQDRVPGLVALEVLNGNAVLFSGKERSAPWRESELRWIKKLSLEGHPLTNSGVDLLDSNDDEEMLLEAIERGREMFGSP